MICIQKWCDWETLKAEVSSVTRGVMKIIEEHGKEKEAMKILGKQPGPMDKTDLQIFINSDLLDELGIKEN